jgi:hypothetical protein
MFPGQQLMIKKAGGKVVPIRIHAARDYSNFTAQAFHGLRRIDG